jgi:hypothetical protein
LSAPCTALKKGKGKVVVCPPLADVAPPKTADAEYTDSWGGLCRSETLLRGIPIQDRSLLRFKSLLPGHTTHIR